MSELLLVPFTEDGYLKLARFLRGFPRRVLLPIPRSVCSEVTHKLLSRIPQSFIRIWNAVLDLIDSGLLVNYECYIEDREFEKSIESSVKLAFLVLKARAWGKLDVKEWLELVELGVLTPRFTSWKGLLVVDRYTDYYVLIKHGIPVNRVVQVDVFAPTPMDIFILATKDVIDWRCSLEDIARWAVTYIGDYVIPSFNLTEAYRKLVASSEYREFIEKCAPREELLHYWLCAPRG